MSISENPKFNYDLLCFVSKGGLQFLSFGHANNDIGSQTENLFQVIRRIDCNRQSTAPNNIDFQLTPWVD